MKTTTHRLSNGLRVILIDTQAFPTVTTLLLVGAGSRFESPKNNGIAHFLEHMFYKGSKNYPNPEIISKRIEGMGGHWNAFTSKDYTGYYIKAGTDHFTDMVDIISDLLLRSLFESWEIEKEKGVIVEEINMYEDMPQRRISEIFENVMFEGNPLGFDIAGTKETVTSFDRNTFVNYMKSLYSPENAVFVVAGGLSETSSRSSNGTDSTRSHYMDVVKEKFGSWKKGSTVSFPPFSYEGTGPRIHITHKKTEQAHFCLGFPTFSIKDHRRPALKVLATVLGGGASSRLFQEVREKRGYCYYIGTGIEQYQEVGNIVTQSGVAKDIKKVKEAVRATLAEHAKMAEGHIQDEDIARSKEMLKGRLYLSLEDSFNVAHFYGMRQLHEHIEQTPDEAVREIEAVTKQDLVALAKELFTKNKLNFAIIGPFEGNAFSPSEFPL